MKRVTLTTVLGLFLVCLSGIALAEEKILNLYGWAGYLPESVIKQFEAETGIRINYSTYVNNEALYAKLKANPDAGYDVIIPSSYFISRMQKHGLIQKIDTSKLKHYKYIQPDFLNKDHDPKNEYSVPYLWNGTGIVINTRYVEPNSIHSWGELWLPRYQDQLLILDDTRESFSIALMMLGYSVNDTNPTHIKEAFEKLKALMSNIKLFNLEAQRSIYLDEDIAIGMGWNGDIFLAKQDNPNLHYIYPKEGFVITLDTLAIPAGAKHIKNAYEFIDFVLRPDIAKEITLDSGFSTPNSAAKKLLPAFVRRDPILYPNAEILKRAQFQADVGEAAPLYEKYFERLKLEK